MHLLYYNAYMDWFNYYGLIIMAIIMIPNIIYAIRHRDDAEKRYHNRAVEAAEQIGRYGCMICMVINIPHTYFGFWFQNGLAVYLAANGGFCMAYCLFWIKRSAKVRALSLSILPTCMFLGSGILLASVPLIAFALVFGPAHIFISYKTALLKET